MSSVKAASMYSTLVAELETMAREPPAELLHNEALRKRLLDAAQSMIPQIESPHEATQRIIYTPLENMGAMIGVNLGLFVILSNSEDSMSTESLAERTGADPQLLERLLKFIASLSMIKEVDVGLWCASRLTKTLAIPGIAAGVFNNHYNIGPTFVAFPEFLERTKYQTTLGPNNCAFSSAHEGKSVFHWLGENPKNAQQFNLWMTRQRFGQAGWLDLFPFENIVCEGASSTKPIFVDVGGGLGHQCESLLSHFPKLAGRVILEDQPSVLDNALSIKGMEKIHVDFFQEQPVKGARAYYLRNVLHDWPDDKCMTILSHLKAAMDLDSLLLIDEMVVPTKGAHKIAMQVDLTMYSNLSSEERTEKRWKELLDAAGFNINQVYTYQAELKDSIIVASVK